MIKGFHPKKGPLWQFLEVSENNKIQKLGRSLKEALAGHYKSWSWEACSGLEGLGSPGKVCGCPEALREGPESSGRF